MKKLLILIAFIVLFTSCATTKELKKDTAKCAKDPACAASVAVDTAIDFLIYDSWK